MLSRLDHLQSYEFQVNAGWEKTYVTGYPLSNLTKRTQKFFCSVNASNLTEKTQKSLHVENMLLWFIHMNYSNVTERNLCSFQYINYIGPVLERFPPDIFFPVDALLGLPWRIQPIISPGDALLGLPWRIMLVNVSPTHTIDPNISICAKFSPY